MCIFPISMRFESATHTEKCIWNYKWWNIFYVTSLWWVSMFVSWFYAHSCKWTEIALQCECRTKKLHWACRSCQVKHLIIWKPIATNLQWIDRSSSPVQYITKWLVIFNIVKIWKCNILLNFFLMKYVINLIFSIKVIFF